MATVPRTCVGCLTTGGLRGVRRLAPLWGACGVDRLKPVVSADGLNHRRLTRVFDRAPAGVQR